MYIRSRKRKSLAVTLVEIMVAMVIASFVSLGFMASIGVVLKSNAENRLHFYAVQQVAYYQNLAVASDYDKLGKSTLTASDIEYVFRHKKTNPLLIEVKEGRGGIKTPIKMWFELAGWGTVSAVNGQTLTVTLPTGQDPWQSDMWKDRYVSVTRVIGGKTAVSSFGRIKTNGGNSFTYTSDLTGAATTPFSPAPQVGDSVLIDNGKTLTINVEWGNGKKHRHFSRRYLIQQRLD